METVILLFLLALSDKNGEVKKSLNSFLEFYRENRDLIKSIAGVIPEAQSQKEQNSRPFEEKTGSDTIFEEYLKRYTEHS